MYKWTLNARSVSKWFIMIMEQALIILDVLNPTCGFHSSHTITLFSYSLKKKKLFWLSHLIDGSSSVFPNDTTKWITR